MLNLEFSMKDFNHFDPNSSQTAWHQSQKSRMTHGSVSKCLEIILVLKRAKTLELLLPTILCLIFLLYLHGRWTPPGALTNWPVFGKLPGLAVNLHCLYDFATDILGPFGCAFLFLGPWFFYMKFLVTCDPAYNNHIFNVNFHNYLNGHKFSENFDNLGDNILSADHEFWSR
ncbi:hypothetical protein IEQ34_019212 [Dendrobium chrysotoxum]|uniref:Uncharacterized protein n=1 Tax=Dendrobium chrysotoxum TaxID=161865 RepID=A0AAV7G7X4_DENCH|nr:hypothetical protein IEQ34_019212 [Dendrobium chrysotoxum]